MKSRVQRWGDSLAVRIPPAFAAEVNVTQETTVDISVEHGILVIRPIPPSGPTLDELLAGVTDENIHVEADYGVGIGNEAW